MTARITATGSAAKISVVDVVDRPTTAEVTEWLDKHGWDRSMHIHGDGRWVCATRGNAATAWVRLDAFAKSDAFARSDAESAIEQLAAASGTTPAAIVREMTSARRGAR